MRLFAFATLLALVAIASSPAVSLAQAPAKAATKPAAAAPKGGPAKAAFTAEAAGTCYGCHAPIKEFHAGSKHGKVGCGWCHDGVDKHLADPSARPTTKTDPRTCGNCHKNQ